MSRTVTIEHKHFYNEDEVKELAISIASAVAEKSLTEDEKANETKRLKKIIDGLDADIQDIGKKITQGYEIQSRVARYENDYERMVRVYYDDVTGEFLKEERLVSDEAQPDMFGTASNEEANVKVLNDVSEAEEAEYEDLMLSENNESWDNLNNDEEEEEAA